MDSRPLRPSRFSKDSGRWIEEPLSPRPVGLSSVTFVTFNVWFAALAFEKRRVAMMRLLRESDADVIALQEVTDDFLRPALQEDWLRERYRVSDATGGTVRGYGVVLWSRLPMEQLVLHDLPTGMRRHALAATFRVNGSELVVATSHLESLRESEPTRAMQLKRLFELLGRHENAVLMGDMNFCSTWDEDRNLDDRFVDLWPLLHPDDEGFTHGTPQLRREKSGKEEPPVRFDRILVKSAPGALKAKEIRLLGTEQIDGVHPSDHFGLRAVLVPR